MPVSGRFRAEHHTIRNCRAVAKPGKKPAKKVVCIAAVAQLVERVLGKDEVMGPTPISS